MTGMIIVPKPMVISFPKCGRTWIANVLITYINYCQKSGSPPSDFNIKPDFKPAVKGTPFEAILFSHDVFSMKIPIKKWPRWSAVNYHRKCKALLLRDPRDLLVSLYHHLLGRTYKNNLSPDTTIRQFLEIEPMGLDALISFLNIWAKGESAGDGLTRVFYYENFLGGWEENRSNWISFTKFITGQPVNQDALQRAVEEYEINRLKKRLKDSGAQGPGLTGLGGRIRKGRARGYLDELEPDDIEFIESRMLASLNEQARELVSRYF
jgi:hypothetical protein